MQEREPQQLPMDLPNHPEMPSPPCASDLLDAEAATVAATEKLYRAISVQSLMSVAKVIGLSLHQFVLRCEKAMPS